MADGVVEEVADGVLRVLVPVPFGRLGDVNCYLLHGRDGWTVVDTGINTSAARAAWQAATAATGLSSADLRQILLTHTHPDHLGLAGWLQRCAEERCESAVPVRLSRASRR